MGNTGTLDNGRTKSLVTCWTHPVRNGQISTLGYFTVVVACPGVLHSRDYWRKGAAFGADLEGCAADSEYHLPLAFPLLRAAPRRKGKLFPGGLVTGVALRFPPQSKMIGCKPGDFGRMNIQVVTSWAPALGGGIPSLLQAGRPRPMKVA